MKMEYDAALELAAQATRAGPERVLGMLESYEHQLTLQGAALQAEMRSTAFQDGALAAVRVMRAGVLHEAA